MHRKRLFIVAFIVGAATFGIPSQVSAAPSIPRSLTAVRTVLTQVAPGESRLLSVLMPWRANLIGVSYVDRTHSENGVSIVARAHTVDGWSTWEDVGANDNGSPDGIEARHESDRLTTEPVWIGTADHVEVNVSVAPTGQAIQDVRVHLINSLGDSEQQSFFTRALQAIGHFLSLRADTGATPAAAQTNAPAMISRALWGANPSYLNLPCPGTAPDLKMAFVHHADTTNSYTKSQSAGIVRGIYAYHTNTRGYCDIAYNFLIDKYGQIFEGRNGGVTNNVIGAHTGGYNYGTVGVALLGNLGTAKPTSAMLSALERLLAWRLDIAHVPATGVVYMTTGTGNDHTAAGTVVKFNRIAGHRDASQTSCPGSYMYNDLPGVRIAVTAMGAPKIYLPIVTPETLRPDGDTQDEMVRATAQFSTTVSWTFNFIASNGAVVRTVTGRSTGMKFYWGAQTATGAYVPNGIYRWTLAAVDSAGHHATSASGEVTVVTTHPDGTLLQDSSGRYVIQSGAARAVNDSSYASTYGTLPSIATGPNERARYATGAPLPLREGTLLAFGGERYIWSGGALRHFTGTTFSDLGYQAAAAITTSTIDGLPLGPDVTDSTVHPDGTAINSGGRLYVVSSGTLRPLSALARASWYRTNEIVPAVAGDALPTGAGFPVRDGTYIRANDGGAPWLVSDGTKHRFISSAFATYMGFASQTMLTASQSDVDAIPTGDVLAAGTTVQAVRLLPCDAGSGTLFAGAVAGGNSCAMVLFGTNGVHVLPNAGSTFGSNSAWTSNAYFGTRGNAIDDVTGDGKSDAIVVNDRGVTVRRSDGTKFLGNETWTSNAYYGSHGTYFADVTGDGRADAIVVNNGTITVRRSNGSKFLGNESWTTNPYYGSFGTYFADVTGDGRADAIAVNSWGITVRPSDGTKFLGNQTWTTSGFYGDRGTSFADVNGDGKADAISVGSSGIAVRLSTGKAFGAASAWTTNPYYGAHGTLFSDLTGDGKADGIVVGDSAITARPSSGTDFLANQTWFTGVFF